MKLGQTAGKSFLVTHSCRDIVCDTFSQFIESGFKGLWVTRSDPLDVSKRLPSESKVLWLSSSERSYFNKIDSLEMLKSEVISFIKKNRSVVLIERFDYLLNKYGHQQVLDTLYSINDEIMFSESMLLLRINPLLTTKDFLSHLEQEFDRLPVPDYSMQFDNRHDLKEMIDFICLNNGTDSKKVYKALGITRTTARKRLYTLRDMGFIKILKNGRTNSIQLTDKGKAYKGLVRA